jgi:integrase
LAAAPVSGHVFRVQRQRGPAWYAKYRLPDGRQVQRRIGPAWTTRGRPAAGYFTKRSAEAWLHEVLEQARAGTLPGLRRSNATVADAAAEWLRYVVEDRAIKPSTQKEYRSMLNAHILPAFGDRPLEALTARDIERWRARLSVCPRTKNKLVTVLHGIYRRAQRVWDLSINPALNVERLREPRSLDMDVFTPEEVMALVRAAASEQDAAIVLTAAFTGLRRGELVALRWRDVDFAASLIRVRATYAHEALTTPKSGRVRSVPMAPAVAAALARLGQRGVAVGDVDQVFLGAGGGYLDGSALRRRYERALERAGLRRLRFHDLRHTFGTRMIAVADIVRVRLTASRLPTTTAPTGTSRLATARGSTSTAIRPIPATMTTPSSSSCGARTLRHLLLPWRAGRSLPPSGTRCSPRRAIAAQCRRAATSR